MIAACGGSDPAADPDFVLAADAGVVSHSADAGSTSGDAATARDSAVSSTAPGADGGAKDCSPGSLDQQGCGCTAVATTRVCYPGPVATQNKGVCHDGLQTCMSGAGEFGQVYGPCKDFEIPRTCSQDVDAHCSGKVGCDDPDCATELQCETDAGMPPCIPTTGQNGNVTLPNGSMYCEGDGLGGLIGGLFGG